MTVEHYSHGDGDIEITRRPMKPRIIYSREGFTRMTASPIAGRRSLPHHGPGGSASTAAPDRGVRTASAPPLEALERTPFRDTANTSNENKWTLIRTIFLTGTRTRTGVIQIPPVNNECRFNLLEGRRKCSPERDPSMFGNALASVFSVAGRSAFGHPDNPVSFRIRCGADPGKKFVHYLPRSRPAGVLRDPILLAASRSRPELSLASPSGIRRLCPDRCRCGGRQTALGVAR